MNYEDALERALALRSDLDALETFLRTVEHWRADIETDLLLTQQTRSALQAAEPSNEAAAQAEQQLFRLVGVLEARGAASAPVPEPRPGFFGRLWQGRLAIATAAAAAIIVAALLLGGPGGSSIAPSTAEAVVIEGSVTAVGADAVTLDTNGGPRTISLGGAVLRDGFGNPIDLSALQPGQVVILTARASDGVLVAQRLEVKDRLFGTITASTGDSIAVQAGAAQYVIRLSSQTRIEGALVPGASVEVRVERAADGSFLAERIEVEDRDDDDNSGPGSGDDNDNSGPGGGRDDDNDNSGPGGGRDDGDNDNSGPGGGAELGHDRGGSSWSAHLLPSGSVKYAKDPQGITSTSVIVSSPR